MFLVSKIPRPLPRDRIDGAGAIDDDEVFVPLAGYKQTEAD